LHFGPSVLQPPNPQNPNTAGVLGLTLSGAGPKNITALF
jgi:hypothetical protein